MTVYFFCVYVLYCLSKTVALQKKEFSFSAIWTNVFVVDIRIQSLEYDKSRMCYVLNEESCNLLYKLMINQWKVASQFPSILSVDAGDKNTACIQMVYLFLGSCWGQSMWHSEILQKWGPCSSSWWGELWPLSEHYRIFFSRMRRRTVHQYIKKNNEGTRTP